MLDSWSRRVTLETAVHRCDLELASAATPGPIDAALAEDGIDEWINVILQTPPNHRIDVIVDGTNRSWTLGSAPQPSAVVRGGASAILLVMWRRCPIDLVRVDGNHRLAEIFFSSAELL
jgi:hypothetical protein